MISIFWEKITDLPILWFSLQSVGRRLFKHAELHIGTRRVLPPHSLPRELSFKIILRQRKRIETKEKVAALLVDAAPARATGP